MRNVLRQAERPAGSVDPARLEAPEEQALHAALTAARSGFTADVAAADYESALRRLASLQAPVDAFFTAVMVMAEDPALRDNRLALLGELDLLCREVADISLLPG